MEESKEKEVADSEEAEKEAKKEEYQESQRRIAHLGADEQEQAPVDA